MSIVGNSIKIRCDFTDWDNISTDPSSATVTIYEHDKSTITSFAMTTSSKVSLGTYETTYIVPDGYGNIVVEVKAVVDSIQCCERQTVVREFADEVN